MTPNRIPMTTALPDKLKIALKEWATVGDALETGRQIILLRKGGIYEAAGEFELENSEFLLFPTYLHQNAAMLKPAFRDGLSQLSSEPAEVRLSSAGVVSDIIRLSSRQQIDAIDDEHVWASPLIDMRFNYKPQNPLYLLIVRAYRLAAPVVVPNTPAYAGCKSWVPLDMPIALAGATPALDDTNFETRRRTILQRLSLGA
jgi:hypothetical protein